MQLDHQAHSTAGVKFPLVLLAHNISSPFNVGGLFRLADALGISKICLSGDTPIPPNKKIVKTARSTEKYVDFEAVEHPFELLKALKAVDYKIICLEICDNSIDLEALPSLAEQKICLVLGEENNGVHEDFLAMADYVCHIPMQGNNSSMNLVSATAIASYAIIKKMNL